MPLVEASLAETIEIPAIEAAQGPDYLAPLRLMRGHLGDSSGRLAFAIGLATLGVFAELAPVWAVYRLVTAAVAGTLDWPLVTTQAAVAALGVIVGFAAMGLALGQSHLVAFDVIHRVRLAAARHMARLPLGYFADRPSGDAKKQVVDEPEKLEAVVAHGLPEGVSSVATWLAVSIWLFVVDWRMALAAIVLTPASFVLLAIGMKRGGRFAVAYQGANARMNAAIVEYLAGMPVVKVFNRTGESFAETSMAARAYADIETRWARAYLPLGGAFYMLVIANIVVILPVGLMLVKAGTLDLPTLLLFVILGANYSQPLLKLFNQFHGLAHIAMGSSAVADLLAQEPQADSGTRVVLRNHDVAFANVRFGYGESDVLHGVSFLARTGEVTALVGPSGSGKSTIAALVARFRDVREGAVSIGGVDVRDMAIDQLMETVAFVFQDTFLFSDTIAANIRFGNPEASDDQVRAAAEAARAHDFIMALDHGYDTRLGEQGRTLSGGERQRIAIARAILKDAPVIVLDEATAFADPDNEAAIQDAIAALTKGRTLIIVAHRLHTIMAADQILCIDRGHVAERGRHEQLLEQHGLYARLWEDYLHARNTPLRPAHPTPPSTITQEAV